MRQDFPLPDIAWEPAAGFWEGAGRGELCIPRCERCDTLCWYPAEQCRVCGSATFGWSAVSGRGRLFSWTVVRHAFLSQFRHKVPFVTGLVALEDDPRVRLVTELVDCEPGDLYFEMPVRVVFRRMTFPGAGREVVAPYFVPR